MIDYPWLFDATEETYKRLYSNETKHRKPSRYREAECTQSTSGSVGITTECPSSNPPECNVDSGVC